MDDNVLCMVSSLTFLFIILPKVVIASKSCKILDLGLFLFLKKTMEMDFVQNSYGLFQTNQDGKYKK